MSVSSNRSIYFCALVYANTHIKHLSYVCLPLLVLVLTALLVSSLSKLLWFLVYLFKSLFLLPVVSSFKLQLGGELFIFLYVCLHRISNCASLDMEIERERERKN